MNRTEPRVYLIGQTQLNEDAVRDWMSDLGGEAVFDHIAGSDSEKLIELAGRRCYKSFDVGLNPNVTRIRKDSEEYHANVIKSGHGSVTEHAWSSWAIEGVSRVFTHELVRHRAGTAFSQESLRYVRLTDIPFWVPPDIEENDEARAVFERMVDSMEKAQEELAEIYGIDEMKNFGKKKMLTSSFRRVAPIGLATGILFSCNVRALRWTVEMRTSRHAEVEIRKVFCQIFNIAKEQWPFLFQDFETIDTEDGLFECIPSSHKV